jgi:hypothetical protein
MLRELQKAARRRNIKPQPDSVQPLNPFDPNGPKSIPIEGLFKGNPLPMPSLSRFQQSTLGDGIALLKDATISIEKLAAKIPKQ